eukprot:6490416-Amphidinium_carterae.3
MLAYLGIPVLRLPWASDRYNAHAGKIGRSTPSGTTAGSISVHREGEGAAASGGTGFSWGKGCCMAWPKCAGATERKRRTLCRLPRLSTTPAVHAPGIAARCDCGEPSLVSFGRPEAPLLGVVRHLLAQDALLER